MVDTTTPTTPSAQDLQINLEEAPKVEIPGTTKEQISGVENIKPKLDLNLDLNLPDAPKNDDRLKTEDQNNEKMNIPRIEPVIEQKTIEQKREEPINEQEGKPVVMESVENLFASSVDDVPSASKNNSQNETSIGIETTQAEQPIEKTPEIPTMMEPVGEIIAPTQTEITPTASEKSPENIIEETVQVTPESQVSETSIFTPEKTPEVIIPETINPNTAGITETQGTTVSEAPQIQNTKVQIEEPATKIEDIPISSQSVDGNVPEASSLQKDMKIIEELEGHTSGGGLAAEATIIPQTQAIETAKTFDLDAMLGNPIMQPIVETSQPVIQPVAPQTMTQTIPEPIVIPTPQQTFTIPTTTTQVPIQSIIQTNIPHKKNVGVKVFLFVIMFAGLGFTTFFILKTMYPVEFGDMFGNPTPMHASEITTGTETIGTEITGTDTLGIQQITGVIDTGTGTHESAPPDNTFGELNDLGTPATEPVQSDISKLTDYINQGNKFLEQGKTLKNNNIIMKALFISKKSTTFLEDIANGKEISNLSGYFAQFNKYVIELNTLVGEANTGTTIPVPELPSPPEPILPQAVSPTPPPNGFGDSTMNINPPQNTGITAE